MNISNGQVVTPTERRILITGGSGFIGTNLVEHYIAAGVPVTNFDHLPPKAPGHRGSWYRGDIRDAAAVRRVTEGFAPTHIVHLAARVDIWGRRVADYAANVAGVRNVIAAAEAAPDLQRIVFASSRMVARIGYIPESDEDYCPPNAYGESKAIGERIVRESALGCSWVIVRPTSIWGPWFGVPYRDFFMAIARNRYVHVRGASVEKSFGFVFNSVHQLDALLCASDREVHGTTIYMADYPPIRVEEMANCIAREIGARKIRSVPLRALKPVAIVGDVLKRLGWTEPPLTTFRLANLLTQMVYDLTPLERIVGPLPHSMQDGVRITVAWLRAQGPFSPSAHGVPGPEPMALGDRSPASSRSP
jgi:nucleoside-diphosphate-sugar epimerase